MNRITRTAITALIGLGAIICLTAPMVGAMLLALTFFPEDPSALIPSLIVAGGTLAGLGLMTLYSLTTEHLLPANR